MYRDPVTGEWPDDCKATLRISLALGSQALYRAWIDEHVRDEEEWLAVTRLICSIAVPRLDPIIAAIKERFNAAADVVPRFQFVHPGDPAAGRLAAGILEAALQRQDALFDATVLVAFQSGSLPAADEVLAAAAGGLLRGEV